MDISLRELKGEFVDRALKDDVEEFFAKTMRPRYLMQNKMNEVIEMEKSFEQSCSVLQDNGIQNPKALNVFEFYSKIEFLETKLKDKNGKL